MKPAGVDIGASLDAIDAGEHQTGFRGWSVIQMPDDLDRLGAVITATRPNVVVETGTHTGGMALWYADRVPAVLAVDVNPDAGDAVRGGPPWLSRSVTLLTGRSSVDPGLVAEVSSRLVAAGGRVMVVLDSLHTAAHVTTEIDAYAPMVTPGCYLVVQDAIYDHASGTQLDRLGMPYIATVGGPRVAIEARLATSPWWRRAVEIEGLTPLSQCPYGWWQRL